ncbi:unnamed protein product, partial [Polarella glacialis]
MWSQGAEQLRQQQLFLAQQRFQQQGWQQGLKQGLQTQQHFQGRPQQAASSLQLAAASQGRFGKAVLCQQWQYAGRCQQGAACNFAHGPEELSQQAQLQFQQAQWQQEAERQAALQ